MSLKRVNGVYFDGRHSYYDFGLWLSNRPDLGSPNPKTNTIEVPGADGIIDMTEANAGEVKFTNRTIVLNFVAMAEIKDQAEFKMRIMTALHGKTISQIVFDEDSDWFYSGRATVAFSKVQSWKLGCTITIDAAPYATKIRKTVVDLVGETPVATDIELPGVDTTPYPYNTRLVFGSKTFPGLNLMEYPGFSYILLKWPDNAERTPTNAACFYQVASVGGVYTSPSIDQQYLQNGEYSINTSVLTQAGVDITKIYQITFIGIGSIKAYRTMPVSTVHVWNERKQVVPLVDLVATSGGHLFEDPINIYVNGSCFQIVNGAMTYEDILLRSGWNTIQIQPFTEDYSIEKLEISFWEGKL